MLSPYSACLPILNGLRTEGLSAVLVELKKAEEQDVSGSLTGLLPESKTKVTDIAAELAGSDKASCDGAAIKDSKVWLLAPSLWHTIFEKAPRPLSYKLRAPAW